MWFNLGKDNDQTESAQRAADRSNAAQVLSLALLEFVAQ
jgi:hypothetical protein